MKNQKIIDCTLFLKELELLELRLESLYPHVDLFLIVESTKTFTGISKPLHYHNNKDRFKKWSDKIRYYVIDDMPLSANREELVKSTPIESQQTIEFFRETHQRNSIGKGLKSLNISYDDIIIVSDMDEFPNYNRFKNLNINLPYGPVIFKQKWLVWNTQLEKTYPWMGSTAFYYSHYIHDKYIFQKIRDDRWNTENPRFYIEDNGGFHFSSFGSLEFIRTKLKSFSHIVT